MFNLSYFGHDPIIHLQMTCVKRVIRLSSLNKKKSEDIKLRIKIEMCNSHLLIPSLKLYIKNHLKPEIVSWWIEQQVDAVKTIFFFIPLNSICNVHRCLIFLTKDPIFLFIFKWFVMNSKNFKCVSRAAIIVW